METIVQIKNVTKKIGKKVIIDDLTFDVRSGEVFGFLGPNGAGKTTTIKMLLGLMSITKGEMYIDGLNVEKDFEKAIVKVGGIIENPDLYKYLTGYQNLVHFWRMYPDLKKERIDEVIKIVGLEKRINDKIKTYSLGMRQRLGVAQALLNSPKLLVLDEPTNGLDPAGIHELRNHLRTLAREENVAVIVSSHLLSEMELMCDRVGILQNGKLVRIQDMKEMLEDESDSVIALDVSPIESAKAYLESLSSKYKPEINEKEIEIKENIENVPGLVEKLVQQGIKIYGVRKVQQSLEKKFLEMTGGNGIA
ncbi:ABC transporter ATP-binding protein [Clostridium sp. CM028]|uniref:ABC transporter ATP-binding protein n=1 Tax=unclassified Clostridium TaxID=2614128 RepID=UPI001C0DB3A7|nr:MULTISPECIES: ABC transporter ATP-binding protein [unclassified Clostridium]MBU3090505.1 ABC transporter ATP-binding protein [Clostridium sp. CF011]MBW9145902.1 ABC transporter ATP-binding protein [Clostridium sp. CM027]MBW9149591.1 ABC transporter ATP-binding protein [Clostridium sp. CM028]UVE40881.1 ABC transporter ATP-binding protein [Clostridium sp. CM027]WAG69866.1 ABC transporter ATP-binding protein [Clostridium sp. CF011]